MNRSILLLIACLLLIGTLVWGIVGTDPVVEPGTGPRAEAEDEAGRNPLRGGPGRESADRKKPDSSSGEGQQRQIVDGITIRVTGRCIGAEAKAPLVGCLVSVKPRQTGFRGPGTGRDTGGGSVTAATGRDGRFAIEMRVNRRQTLVLTTRLTGHADISGNLGQGVGDIDTGDIEIPAGARLQGRVVDERGKPPITSVYVAVTPEGSDTGSRCAHQLLSGDEWLPAAPGAGSLGQRNE